MGLLHVVWKANLNFTIIECEFTQEPNMAPATFEKDNGFVTTADFSEFHVFRADRTLRMGEGEKLTGDLVW